LWEKGLLERLAFLSGRGCGDDAALIATQVGQSLVVTTMLVDGVHLVIAPLPSAGWRAAAANLSDLAAMGATRWESPLV